MAHRTMLFLALAATAFAAPALAQNRDNVIICQTLEPPILDPTGGAAAAIREITYDNIFENLLAITGDGARVPRLAESWTSSTDGMVHTFKLRAGVTFHDGTPMTSADVKFSLERGQAPDAKHSQKWIFAPIGAIETPDPLTVVITLKEFVGDFIESLALSDAAIVSPQSIAKAATDPVGTGPYQFVRWQRGDRVVMKRNEAYWGKKPAIANATFRFVTDPQAQVAALLAGDCDAHTNIGAPESVDQLKRDAKLRVTIGRTEGETIMAMNATKPPFNDVRVRKAVSMAIDRALVNEGAMSGFGALIGSHFSPNHPAYLDLTREVRVDTKAAKALLAEAGYPQGFTVSMRLPPPAYARRSGEIIAAMLAEIGIKASIEPVEWPQWLERVFRNKDYDLSIVAHVEPGDINIYARDGYYIGIPTPEMKAIIERTKKGRTEAERNAAFQEAQRKITAEYVAVYLYMLPKITVAKAGLKGMWQHWPVPANPLRDLVWE